MTMAVATRIKTTTATVITLCVTKPRRSKEEPNDCHAAWEFVPSIDKVPNTSRNDAVLNEAVLNDAALNDTILNDTVLNDTVLNDAVLNDTVLNDTVLTDAPFTAAKGNGWFC